MPHASDPPSRAPGPAGPNVAPTSPVGRGSAAPAGSDERLPPWLLPGLVLAGVAARTAHLLSGRSLWLDEAMIALNIERRGFAELIGTLDFNQAAPPGFLWLERAAALALGMGEWALRLWPYLASLAALVVFALLARRLLRPAAAAFAVGLFAVSGSLVYYAAEVKQYSFDVAAAVLLLWIAARAGGAGSGPTVRAGDRRRWLLLAAAGALGVWFSHPLVFVLPGALLYAGWSASRGPGRRALAGAALLWAASFAAAFLLTARGASESPLMARFWIEGFMPIPPTSGGELAWFTSAAVGWVRNAFDFTESTGAVRGVGVGAGLLLAGAGIVRGWRIHGRELALVGAPILLALTASALRLYPFEGRLILFLVPSTVILFGWGAEAGAALLGARRGAGPGADVGRPLPRAVGGLGLLAAAGALTMASLVVLAGWLRAPHREELRPVLEAMAERVEPGDVVYVHSGAQHAQLFYERTCPDCRLEGAELVRGRFLVGDEEALRAEIGSLPRAGRLWAVFSHEWWGYGDRERDRIVALLSAEAASVDSVTAPGAEAYRFAFGSASREGASPEGASPEARGVDRLLALTGSGRVEAAVPLARELARAAWEEGGPAQAAWIALRPAYARLYGAMGGPAAVRLADSLLSALPITELPESERPDLELADFFSRAGQPDRARALATRAAAGSPPHLELERLRALLDLAEGEPGAAAARLEALRADSGPCAACLFDLGLAYEALGRVADAIAAYRGFLDAPASPARPIEAHARPYALRRLGALHARLAESSAAPEEEEGRSEEEGAAADARQHRDAAVAALRAFLTEWAGADPAFREMVEAVRRRLAALAG